MANKMRLGWICAILFAFGAYGCDDSATPTSSDSNQETPDNPDQPINPDNPDTPDKPDNPDKPNNPDEPKQCQAQPDEDGDTISDADEGRDLTSGENDANHRDSDGDTIPDYLDPDSDNDTIPDRIEAGNDGCSANPPFDTNMDFEPDYLDADSDGNGIPDAFEGCYDPTNPYTASATPATAVCDNPTDTNGDTIPDYRDNDNDGDSISDRDEISGLSGTADDAVNGTFSGDCDGDGKHDTLGSPDNPIDCDGDTIPDYMDPDSDNDTIPDRVEGRYMINNLFARYNKDADGDTIPDADEAGDDPKNPRDTDGDTIPDYLDLDSDGDGLLDAWEREHEGYNPYLEDTDGDGVSDLVEFGARTDPADPSDNPQSRGNFVFVTPYNDTSTPSRAALSFETAVQSVDLYFAFDSSFSMDSTISALSKNLPTMLDNLKCKDFDQSCKSNEECAAFPNAICSESGKCIQNPKYDKGCFDNMWTGVGFWGSVNSFKNERSLSQTPDAVVSALNSITYNQQGNKENLIQPPICAVFGSQYCSNTNTLHCYDGDDRFGCVGFRKNAVKFIIEAADSANSDSGEFTVANATKWGKLLQDNKIRYFGLYNASENAKDSMNTLARAAGACDQTDCSKVADSNLFTMEIDSNETKFIKSLQEKLLQIVKTAPIDITTVVEDIDENASKLVARLELIQSGKTVQNRICAPINAPVTSDDFPTIKDIIPGTTLCFDVIPVDKQTVIPATNEPRIVTARIKILGDGSVLNSGIAYFLIPPAIPEVVVVN